ncbi:MAG TPA: hypothetical protein VF950_14010 [Planctomycetota bacterium]
MSRSLWLLFLAGGSTLLTVNCAAGPLATIPEGVRVDVPVAFSRDGRHCAYAERAPDGSRAVRGEWRSKRFDSL